MARPDYLREFVLQPASTPAVDAGDFDLYLPKTLPAPIVVLVHGGPMREQPEVRPRQWPVFRGYAAALAERGVAAAVFDHALLGTVDYAAAAHQLSRVVEAARGRDEIRGDRVALWFFSGGGPLAAPALSEPPPWLRAVAFSYPMLQPLGDVAGYRPIDVLDRVGELPILLTRVGREFPALVAPQAQFVEAARAREVDLTVIDVPDAPHAFDVMDGSDEARAALEQALDHVCTQLS